MILGIGLDLAAVRRIRKARERHGERFLKKVFTEAELSHSFDGANPDEGLAARFAAKEAAMKALGTGWARGVGWLDVEVSKGQGGTPALLLHGRAAELAGKLGVKSLHLSLTHERDTAAAMVILEG